MPARLASSARFAASALAALALAATALAQPVTVSIDSAAIPDSLLASADGELAIGLRGDTAPLAWDRSRPLADPDGDGVYTTTLDFPDGTGLVAYKTVLGRAEDLIWEPGGNRILVPGRMTAERRAFGAPQTDLPIRTVSTRQLAEDLTVLRNAMESLHPGLLLHNSLAQIEGVSTQLGTDARQLGRRYGEAIPVPAAYLPIAKAVAAVRDGHTKVSMYNQGAYTEAMLYARPDRVPFTFRLVEDRMIVTGDATPERTLPAGTEILTLDDRPVTEIIAAMLPYVSADGSNDAKRLDQLQVDALPAPAERFDVLYSLLFQPEGDLAVTLRQPDGRELAISLPRTTQDVRRATLRDRDPEFPRGDADLFVYRLDDDGTAYLSIGSFATFNLDIDYDAWLTETFRDLNARGAERLVVDLRGVAGGMTDAATLLFRHLLSEPVTVSSWQSLTVFDVVPESIQPYLGSWSSDAYDLRERVTPAGDGTFRLPPRPDTSVPPAPDAFAGPTAVIVDATASSATFYLAQAIQETGIARLVGQETGGSLKGLNAGLMFFLTLPNTGLVIDLPVYGSRPSTPGPDRGVLPDLVVEPSTDAVIEGRDIELEVAVDALNGRGASSPLPLNDLVGDWTGTLRYTSYPDDVQRVTLPLSARATRHPDAALGTDALRLTVTFTEPDGSPGGQSTTLLAALPDASSFVYDGAPWTVRHRSADAEGFRLTIETEGEDNEQPATIRHHISYRGGVLTDRKSVRYSGTPVFFERNVFTLFRP